MAPHCLQKVYLHLGGFALCILTISYFPVKTENILAKCAIYILKLLGEQRGVLISSYVFILLSVCAG